MLTLMKKRAILSVEFLGKDGVFCMSISVFYEIDSVPVKSVAMSEHYFYLCMLFVFYRLGKLIIVSFVTRRD